MPDSSTVKAPQYDFSSPFMRATIITDIETAEETRYPLWFQGDSTAVSVPAVSQRVNGTTAASDDELDFGTLGFVSDVSVQLSLGYIPNISVTLTPPLDLARKFIDSRLIEWATSVLEVQVGYATGPNGPVISPPFQGIIQAPDLDFGGDITIGLKGVGTAGYYLSATGQAGVTAEKPRIEIINDFAQALKISRGKGAAPFFEDAIDPQTSKLLQQPKTVVTSTQSKLAVIYEIARQSGCWLDLTGNTLRLVSMQQLVLSESKAVLAFFDFNGKLGPNASTPGVYPILGASSETTGIYLGQYSKQALQTAVDRTKKEVQEQKLEPQKAAATQKGAVANKDKSAETSARVEQSPDQTDQAVGSVRETAAAAMQALETTDGPGVKLEIETLGAPDLIPAMNVDVRGLGKRIDGRYTIFEVKHSVSNSGFSTSLTLYQSNAQLRKALQAQLGSSLFNQETPFSPSSSDTASQLGSGNKVPVSVRSIF